MARTFEHRRWARNEIGFHQAEIHPVLIHASPRLGLPLGAAVIAVLCRKRHDLSWLSDYGGKRLCGELSTLALCSFFREKGLRPELSAMGSRCCQLRLSPGAGGRTAFCRDP